MKVIIAGSKKEITLEQVKNAITNSYFTITEIVSGGAEGADSIGEHLAALYDIPVKLFPAKWSDIKATPCYIKTNRYGQYNALAEHNRNAQMAEYADALIAIWDGKSLGTRNIIAKMKDLNKLVFVYGINT